MKKYRFFGIPFFSVEQTRSIENPNTDINSVFLGMGENSSGSIVTKDTAMSFSAVYACVRIISETIASLPLTILENKEGLINKPNHPLKYFIEQRPNEFMTRFTFWETLISHMLLEGNGYAIIKRSKMSPTDFVIQQPTDVEVVYNQKKGILKYKVEGYEKYIDSSDMLHLAGLSFDGVKGLSPLEYHRNTIGIGLSEIDFQGNFFKNGASLSGVLTTPHKLTDDGFKRMANSWRSTYEGKGNKGKTAILEQGTDYKQIGIKPIDAQFMEQRRFTVEDIARIFRVPLHLLQDLSRSTNNNIEHQSIDFVMHTIRPHIKRIESELNRKIFSEAEKIEGRYYTRFNIDGLLRGDVTSRSNFYKSLYYTGAINANEIRSLEGMNPYDGGDEYRVQSNTIGINETNETNE